MVTNELDQSPGQTAARPGREPINPDKIAARILGERGEDTVAAWYVKHGFRVLDRNWRCAEGELDIVAVDDEVLVFCEVKSRASDRFADPALAVDHRKQARVRRAAFRWLEGHHWPQRIRFDVGIVVSGRIRIIEDAF